MPHDTSKFRHSWLETLCMKTERHIVGFFAGVTPQFDDEVLAMADGFIVDYEAPEGKKYLGEEL